MRKPQPQAQQVPSGRDHWQRARVAGAAGCGGATVRMHVRVEVSHSLTVNRRKMLRFITALAFAMSTVSALAAPASGVGKIQHVITLM